MALNYQIEDLAQEIWTDLDEPDDLSVGAIKFWVRGKVGDINNLLFGSWALNDAGNEITPALNPEEMSIIKSMYFVYYYNRMIRNNLGASQWDSVLELSSDGGIVRKINRNSIAMTYLQMVKQEKETLKSLINAYRINKSSPGQVVGDESLTFLTNQAFPSSRFPIRNYWNF